MLQPDERSVAGSVRVLIVDDDRDWCEAAQMLLETEGIAADVVYVPLYFSRDLNLTGIVYILFLGLAVTTRPSGTHAMFVLPAEALKAAVATVKTD